MVNASKNSPIIPSSNCGVSIVFVFFLLVADWVDSLSVITDIRYAFVIVKIYLHLFS